MATITLGTNSENGEPIDQQAENLRGVELAAALLDEAIDARFFGQNIEIDGTQCLDRRKSQRLGDQPSDNENHDRKQHAGKEFADLHENHADRFPRHIDSFHTDLLSFPGFRQCCLFDRCRGGRR